ncbi:MAG: exodeoxyribonuclease V alpha subunit [Candidatus Azotimanducaceae bacterium]
MSGFETCFVMSIHKSQGSEFDNISVVLPSLQTSTNDLYTKELVYTAITRAKQHVTIFAGDDDLLACLSKENNRASGLSDHLFREWQRQKMVAPA